jgi:hypothetical protein
MGAHWWLPSLATDWCRPKGEIPAPYVEEHGVRRDADRLSQIRVHTENVYRDEHDGKIEQVSQYKNRQKAL